ncbi:hypothetical protein LG651_10530 [Tamlana sp. 62-3]|uniref:Uncharacterized protein n=1 Tax=Neotamlana sargassicola TaxID=2883125 RepID=A0A9X1L507_9FLAO|nr:hypothetical protein [Tamlana sargassicola]MCB4808685.1 hypothetical protein [Tamlana sargassicola]
MFIYFLSYITVQILVYLAINYSRFFIIKSKRINSKPLFEVNEFDVNTSEMYRLQLDNKLKMLHCLSHLELYINDIKLSKHYQFNDFEALKQQTQKSVLESVEKLKA